MRSVQSVLAGAAAPAAQRIAIQRLRAHPEQPRQHFEAKAQAELVESVRLHGVLQPLLVRRQGDDFEIVAGERRYRAALAAGLTELPCVVRDLSDAEVRELQMVENLQRQDLSALEETEAMLRLLSFRLGGKSTDELRSLLSKMRGDRPPLGAAGSAAEKSGDNVIPEGSDFPKQGYNLIPGEPTRQERAIVEEVFARVGRMTVESFRVNRLPLLGLPEDVREALRQGLDYTKARVVARVADGAQRAELLRGALDQAWSVAELRRRAGGGAVAQVPDEPAAAAGEPGGSAQALRRRLQELAALPGLDSLPAAHLGQLAKWVARMEALARGKD